MTISQFHIACLFENQFKFKFFNINFFELFMPKFKNQYLLIFIIEIPFAIIFITI